MAAAFRSVQAGSSTATTSYSATLPAGRVAGDLLFHAVAWSGSITSLIIGPNWTEDLASGTTVNGTTLTFRKFWRIATGDANDNISFSWGTSRRVTYITAAYSTVDYGNLAGFLESATGQVLTTSTTVTTTYNGNLAVYAAKKSLDIYVHASAVLVVYGGSWSGGGLTTRGQNNQTSGPSILLADAFYTMPQDLPTLATIRSISQSPTSIFICNHYTFRDDPLSGSRETVPSYDQVSGVGGRVAADQSIYKLETAAAGVPSNAPPDGYLTATPGGILTNPVTPGLERPSPTGPPAFTYAPGVGGQTIIDRLVIEEQGI